jgi:hypothetical protein
MLLFAVSTCRVPTVLNGDRARQLRSTPCAASAACSGRAVAVRAREPSRSSAYVRINVTHRLRSALHKLLLLLVRHLSPLNLCCRVAFAYCASFCSGRLPPLCRRIEVCLRRVATSFSRSNQVHWSACDIIGNSVAYVWTGCPKMEVVWAQRIKKTGKTLIIEDVQSTSYTFRCYELRLTQPRTPR